MAIRNFDIGAWLSRAALEDRAERYEGLSNREVQELLLDLLHQLINGAEKMDGDFTKLDAAIQDIGTRFDGVENELAAATAANASGNQVATQAGIDAALAHLAVLEGHVDTVTTVAQAAPPAPATDGTVGA